MDRVQVFPGAIPLETDILNTNKNTMIGLAKLAAAMLGTSTQVNGLAVTPTAPASLQVNVAPGEIYQLINLDGTAYSSLAADTTHQIVKQGILLDQVALNCPAPGTVGFSVNYLIEATYSDVDTLPVVLPYYNASNPAVAYSGPANAGTTNNTVRQGKVTLSAKAGTAATTGTQTTPSADSGYVGLYVVTVANGQTQITAGNIAQAAGAPFINTTLLGLSPVFTTSPLGPTPAAGDNSTKLATTAFFLNAFTSGQALSSRGYQKLPGGLIVQWDTTNSLSGSDVAVLFPIAFTTACYGVVVGPGTAGNAYFSNQNGITSTGFNLASWNTSAARVAIPTAWFAYGK